MSVVSLADVKTHLNIQGSVSQYDAELTDFTNRAEAAISQKIGPLTVAGPFTDRVRGYTCSLRLPKFPAAALTSVTPVGATALDITSVQIVPDAPRLVEYVVRGGYFASPWYDVVYTAGRAVSTTTFPDIYLAILEEVRHLFAPQRGAPVGNRGQPPPPNFPGMAYAFPIRVLELLNPYVPLAVA